MSVPTKFVAALVVTATACAPGATSEAVRTEAPTASQAMGEEEPPSCSAVAAKAAPLIVDLDSQGRVDLEVAMKSGLPVVHYGCDGLRILKDCTVVGDYKFAGVSLKEDVLQLKSKDEVHANLPISGASLAGSLERGTSLDLAMAFIGKQTALVNSAHRKSLQGECDGATHVVRGATVGAFALRRGSGAKVAAAADIFVASASAQSESSKQTTIRDGVVEDCRKADPDAEKPPAQCRSAIRVELVPITDGLGEKEVEAYGLTNPCPKGHVLSGSKCSPANQAQSYLCPIGDAAACREQCGKASAGSCYNLGMVLTRVADSCKGKDNCRAVKTVPKEAPDYGSYQEGADAFDKACEGGIGAACFYVASYFELGAYGKDKDAAKARRYRERGCTQGDGFTCAHLARSLRNANKKDPNSFKFANRACDLGDKPGCFQAISQLMKGEGVAKDPARAASILKRTCDAGEGKRCGELGLLVLTGKLIDNDKDKALQYLARGCKLGRKDACALAAQAYAGKMGVPADKDKAKSFFKRSCDGDSAREKACSKLKNLLGF